jgi:hypothetical protein
MEEILRTNDPATLSFAEALLKEASIGYAVLDTNMSVLEGSLGILPRRVVVDRDEAARARTLLAEAGLGGELRPAR